MTSNLVESVNSMFKVARSLPVSILLETTYFKVNTLFVKKRMEANARRLAGHLFSDAITKKIQDIQQAARGLTVSIFSRSQGKFHVRDVAAGHDFFVDLPNRYCDCGYFQTMHYPCNPGMVYSLELWPLR